MCCMLTRWLSRRGHSNSLAISGSVCVCVCVYCEMNKLEFFINALNTILHMFRKYFHNSYPSSCFSCSFKIISKLLKQNILCVSCDSVMKLDCSKNSVVFPESTFALAFSKRPQSTVISKKLMSSETMKLFKLAIMSMANSKNLSGI